MSFALRASISSSCLPALVTTCCLCLTSLSAQALGIGDSRMLSRMGEPLSVELDLVDLGGVRLSDIQVQLATPEDHLRLGLTPPPIAGPLAVQIAPVGLVGVARVNAPGWSPGEQSSSLLLQLSWPGGQRLQQIFLQSHSPSMRQESVAETPSLPQASSTSSSPQPATAQALAVPSDTPTSEVIPVDTRRIRVGPADTLESLAEQWRVQELSLSQRKQLLAEANPHIFHYGDVRQLRPGTVLTLPSGASTRSMPDRADAELWVQRHESGQARVARPFEPGLGMARAGNPAPAQPSSQRPERPEPVPEHVVALTLVAPADRIPPVEDPDRASALKAVEEEREALTARNEELTRRLQQLKQDANDRQHQLRLLDERLAAMSRPLPTHPLTRLPAWEQFSLILLALLSAGFALAGLLARMRTPRPSPVRHAVPTFEPSRQAPVSVPPASSADPDEDEYDFLSDAQVEAFQTRLDLARAYLDMGEIEAARELLRAVVAGGGQAQREDARLLMKTLA